MKKLLIVLGMLTCLFGMTACGQQSDEAAVSVSENPLMTEEEAQQVAEQLILQVDQVVDQGMVDLYAEDPLLASVFESWTAAMEEIGEFTEITGYNTTVTDTDAVIVADIAGTLQNGKVTVTLDANGIVSIETSAEQNKSFAELMTNAALNTLLGMGTVFLVLILIMIIISGFKIIYNIQQSGSKKKEEEIPVQKAVETTPAPVVETEELVDDLELVAVIAAAIAASEGAETTEGFVVRSIKRASSNKWQRA